jgi:hypothetical protein
MISTGTGFGFNEEGWLITNNNVMENGYFAKALFDIPDNQKSELFTKLDI